MTDTYLPISLGQFNLYAHPEIQLWSHAVIQDAETTSDDTLKGTVRIFNNDGRLIGEIDRPDNASCKGRCDAS